MNTPTNAPTLQDRLHEEMKTAMKAGQKERLGVIRMLLSDVKNVDLNPQKPTPEQAVEQYGKKLRKSVEEYEKIGRAEEVTKLKAEIAIVDEFLPKKLGREQTEKLVDEFLQTETFSEKDLGKATGKFLKAHGATVDTEIVKTLLKVKLAGK